MSTKQRVTQSKNRPQKAASKAKPKVVQKTTTARGKVWDYIKKNKLQDSKTKR